MQLAEIIGRIEADKQEILNVVNSTVTTDPDHVIAQLLYNLNQNMLQLSIHIKDHEVKLRRM